MNLGLLTLLELQAASRYNVNDLQYHNYDHAQSVRKQTNFLLCEVSDVMKDAYRMAALYHDVIYIPGAPNGINENASASMLSYDFMIGCKSLSIVESFESMHLAQRMIERTTIEHHMDSKCEEYMKPLLDADLYSLSLPYEEFVVNQKNIIAENLGEPEVKQMHQKSANFLIALAKGTIYRTEKALDLWEAKAQENIKQWYSEAYSK